MGHRFREKFWAGRKRQENGSPETPTCLSIALDKQSNLNYDGKPFSLY
jgi:hypothetical protein